MVKGKESSPRGRSFLRTSVVFMCGFMLGSVQQNSLVFLDESIALNSVKEETTKPQENDALATSQATISEVVKEEATSAKTVLQATAAEEDLPTFFDIARKTGTDKVQGHLNLQGCLADDSKCLRPESIQKKCKAYGHYYDSIYDRFLGPMRDESFQFLEIGYYNGRGFDAYSQFLPQAEKHSMEISCIPEGPRDEGKWPWGNFAAKNKNYQVLLDANRLHCGDASDYDFLQSKWTTQMKRTDAPPLKVVIDDGSHLSVHMVATVFFWFPKIEPGGYLVLEDVEAYTPAKNIRSDFIPQLIKDVHLCGNVESEPVNAKVCFPTLLPYLKSVYCEMHICVLERNDEPAAELSREESIPPPNALDFNQCLY